MKTTLKLSLLSAALLSQLNAQEITLQPLEITSTAIKTDELKSTDAVEIYTQKDIEKAHVQNLYEFLNKETSVTTMPSYGNPFTQKLDMHGYGIGDGYQNIVIKVNGRKLNNIDMSAQLLSSISPNQVEKIEIIKSSGIVESGDGANAGVINIITKQNNEKEVGFYAGTYNTFDGNFYVGQSDDTLSISVSGEAQKNGGIRPIDNNGNKDENKFSNINFDLVYNPTDDLELRLNGLTSDIDVWYAGSMTKKEYDNNIFQLGTKKNFSGNIVPSTGTHQIFSSDIIGTGASYQINDKISINGDFSHEYKTSNFITSNWASTYTYNSYNINTNYNDKDIKITAGIDGFNGDREGSTNITTKDNLAGYITANYKYKRSSFKAGYRYEKVSYEYAPTVGTSLTKDDYLHGAELGYNYMLNKEMSLFANYSKSYQAPDIDRFFKGNGTFNTFIKPMEANNYTLGYNNIQTNNKFKASIYYVALKNEIYLDKTSGGYNNTNIDKSHKYGLDLYDKYLINKEFNIALNYNYVQAIIDEEKADNGTIYHNTKLPGVSDHNVKAMLNYLPNKRTTLSLTQVWRSEAYAADDFGNSFSQKQDAYNSTDIAATYTTKKWEIFAKINNLFNQKNGLWIKDDAIYPVNFTTTAMAGFTLKY